MRYVEPIYRPGPTEWNSYLLQIAYGCSHNKCTFCSFFKNKPFHTRPFDEIKEDLRMAREYAQQYPLLLGEDSRFLKQLYGCTEVLYSLNSYQFSDYSRYDIVAGTEERRAKYRDEQFPKDLQNAYELGIRLVHKAEDNRN